MKENKEVFQEHPGMIKCYEHEFIVRDMTPYYVRDWPVLLAYKEQGAYGDEEDDRGQEWDINPLVTVIKKDRSVRLCMDARKLNGITTPSYEGPIMIN